MLNKVTQQIKGIVIGGWGNDIVSGMIGNMLNGVTPDTLYAAIKTGGAVLSNINDDSWNNYNNILGSFNIANILNTEFILAILSKNRSDLVCIIINTPGGIDWLNKQLVDIKSRLSSNQPTWEVSK